MVMMLRAACDATKNPKFLSLQRTAFDWFLGTNDLHIPLYDFRTKGCSDGLMAGGVNGNQGAESMVSFLLSLLAIIDSYAVFDKIHAPGAPATVVRLLDQVASDPVKGEMAARDEDAAESQIGEAT